MAKKILAPPKWVKGLDRNGHNQGNSGSCTGHAWALAMAIVNSRERGSKARYNPMQLWNAGKHRDGAPNPNSNRGTGIGWVAWELYEDGAKEVNRMSLEGPKWFPEPHGQQAQRYSAGIAGFTSGHQTIAGIKASINAGRPVVLATRWYGGMSRVYNRGTALKPQWWIALGSHWDDATTGYHAIPVIGYDDAKKAVALQNSWGPFWPGTKGPHYVWFSYSKLEKIFADNDASFITFTDRSGT